MSRRTLSPSRLLTHAALVVGLTASWSLPAIAFAAPPELPPEPAAEQPVAVQPAPEPAPAPAAQPAPQPQPQPGWEQPAQPQPAPQPQPQPGWGQPQPQPPPPAYQPPPPQPLPAPPPNPNRGLGLTISGFSIFTVSYLITAVSGTIAIDAGALEIGRPLLIPIVGPFVAGARTGSATLGFGLAFVGVIQAAGFGMGVGGAVVLGRSRRQARLSAAPGGLQLQF